MQVERRSSFIEGIVGTLDSAEYQVLRLIVRGLSNRDIAVSMGLSLEEIELSRASMMQKLGATRTAEAVRIGILSGIDG